jgi:glutaredoxin-related protein
MGMAPELKTAIDELITSNKIVVFMKGTKQFPQCGFSNTVVQVRAPARGGGRLPLAPQPWDSGTNVVKPVQRLQARAHAASGPRSRLGRSCSHSNGGRIRPASHYSLAPTPSPPHPNAQILREMDVPFESVNVLEADAIRSGMKEYSAWPTFPQVYIDGEFYGGCDIMIGG